MAKEQFSNKWGIILAALGMAIGAGNLWRFPRLAGQYGGAFILLWILFLLIWSVPLLLAEFAIGKQYKNGVIGSFTKFAGEKFAWMGFFITICTLGIAFYYSIVTAWAFRYLSFSIKNVVTNTSVEASIRENPDFLVDFWNGLSNSDWFTVILYITVVIVGVLILIRGVKNGLEKANKILIPTLFILLLVIVAVSLSMRGGIKGLQYMYEVDFKHFSNPTIWIEALSQSAWSTGAGWGLMMTLSAFSREDDDITLNTLVGAFGNNTASLLSGMAILPAVFALAPSETEAISYLQQGNQALTFTVIPSLFANIPAGNFLSVIFFVALFVAAFSSLLPMIELFLQNLADLNLTKRMTLGIAILCFVVIGFPSAWSLSWFNNQDWVWGVGLVISGLFVCIALAANNPIAFKRAIIDKNAKIKVPDWFFQSAIYFNILLAVVLLYWWLSQDYSANWFDENGNWNILGTYSNASTITQWGLVILMGVIFNKYIAKKFTNK